MLCTLNSYARVRCAYVTHTLAYAMQTLLIRSHTLCIRYLYACIRNVCGDTRYNTDRRQKLGFKHSKVVRISSFSEMFIRYSNVLSNAVVRLHLSSAQKEKLQHQTRLLRILTLFMYDISHRCMAVPHYVNEKGINKSLAGVVDIRFCS